MYICNYMYHATEHIFRNHQGQRLKRSVNLIRVKRTPVPKNINPDLNPDNLRVKIHNIRSALPEPEIEILYTVYEEDTKPVLAEDAVKLVDENVGNDDAVLLLGHPLKIKAERKILKIVKCTVQIQIDAQIDLN